MPFPGSMVGRSTPPFSHEVDAPWLTAFADAVAVADRGGAHGLRSHPLFPVCVEWPAVMAAARLDEGALLGDERRRGVHATHDLTIHRLLRPGDVVTTTATIDALEPRPRGTFQRLRLDTRDARGELVATTLMGSMFLGVAIRDPEHEPAPADSPSPRPAAPAETRRSTAKTLELRVAADQARAYSEASRIWNPIHTDDDAAVAAGLPAPILHGTCTLGMATSAVLAWAGVDANVVRRIGARFSGMVRMPSTLELGVWRESEDELRFEVVDSDRAPVLRDGRLGFSP